ncbi:isocitrate lyase/phosphoenolpyruvate mutase family protein [Sedimentitalea sp. XS_ASV28]|uniref:isocitrate lyase/phosphoenolpyruvate mutase family protein n=1 Tax=Sedimentitalea sp. XS_ASV28 TaxID=3241296 RepID=UPI003511D79C
MDRLQAYAEAGADLLYAPGVSAAEDIGAIVRAVAPKPVNVLLISPEMRAADLQVLGVARVSVGGFLAAPARAAFMAAAEELRRTGSLPAASFG